MPSCSSARRAARERVGEGFRTVAFGAFFAPITATPLACSELPGRQRAHERRRGQGQRGAQGCNTPRLANHRNYGGGGEMSLAATNRRPLARSTKHSNRQHRPGLSLGGVAGFGHNLLAGPLASLIFVLGLQPVIRLFLRFLSNDSVAFLQFTYELIPHTGNLLQIVIREPAPLFFHGASKLFPFALYLVPIHMTVFLPL